MVQKINEIYLGVNAIEFNVKLARSLYLCLNLILSVLYSYITVKFISVYNFPIYIILFITTLIEFFILLDTSYFKIITGIKTKYLYYMLIGFSIVMFIFKSNINITYVLIFYFVYYLLITIVLLNYNLFVIEESKSIKDGVTDISLYSNLSKLLGFSLGSYIYKVNIEEYLIVFIIVFILFSSLKINNFKNKTEKNSERLVFNKLKRKYIIVNTALLSGTAVFFIPMFIKQLATRNLIQYSSIVFFIPGLTVVLFLILTKKYEINLNKILISYIILDMVFFIFVICKVFLPLQVILLSLIVALGVSISINLRTNFIKINDKEYRKSILQIFRISAPLFTIILSLIGLYLENIAYYILLINILSAVHVLWVNVRKNKVIL